MSLDFTRKANSLPSGGSRPTSVLAATFLSTSTSNGIGPYIYTNLASGRGLGQWPGQPDNASPRSNMASSAGNWLADKAGSRRRAFNPLGQKMRHPRRSQPPQPRRIQHRNSQPPPATPGHPPCQGPNNSDIVKRDKSQPTTLPSSNIQIRQNTINDNENACLIAHTSTGRPETPGMPRPSGARNDRPSRHCEEAQPTRQSITSI